MAKEQKRDLRNGMWERGPVEAGTKGSGERIVPEDADTVEIVSPDSKVPDGQTTRE